MIKVKLLDYTPEPERVVAMATNREGTIYAGAFGERTLGGGQPMTLDTVGWIASIIGAIIVLFLYGLVTKRR